jgi:hypothetical protein
MLGYINNDLCLSISNIIKKTTMKKCIMMAVVILGIITSMKGQAIDGLARVSRVQGKEVYILNQPIRSFETVAEVKSSLKLTSILTRGLVNETITDKANEFVRRAIRKANKKTTQPFDAIVYIGGKKVRAVRFIDEPTSTNQGIAKVGKYFGLEAYILAEPLRTYSASNSTWGGVKGIPLLTYGFVNNSIERDVMTFAKKLSKENKNSQALIYSAGRTAISATFDK